MLGLLLTSLALRLPPQLSRRGALSLPLASLPLSLPLSSLPLPALADVRGANEGLPRNEKDVNKYLASQGFPALKLGGGLSPLVGYIGTASPANIDGSKFKERAFSSTLLVRFGYPSGWLPEIPSITENGEAGTLGANNYIKGDSLTFTSIPAGKDLKLDALTKPTLKSLIISQMSNDVYEDVKVKKIETVTGPDGFDLVVADFSYTLNTRAGFAVNRKGIVSAMITSDALLGLVGATTELRYKDLQPALRESVQSFRAYPVKTPGFNLG